MSYSNNSRNVANLLRFEPLQPIQPRRLQFISNQPATLSNSRQQVQIPTQDLFTPQEGPERKPYKRKTPMSSGGQGQLFPTNSGNDETQIQSLKIRLEQIVKFYDERHRNLENNLSERLNGLESLVMREMPKVDNNNFMKADITGFKQIIKEVRKQMEYLSQEMITLKAIVDQRSITDVALVSDNKEKQKMTVLFLEVVRLADTVEKMESGLGSIGRNYQSRLQQIEHKLANSERNLSLMAQRTTNGNDVLNQFGDKIMDRLQTAQNNLLTLGHERVRDKQTIDQLLIQNERVSQNMQSLLRNMQSDFQNKLENRITETINRLIAQHEQRINAQQQIRRNLDIRQRINQEKQNSDKQQFRARYENMDVLVRNEFQRKEESIRQLQNFIQNEVKNLQKEIGIEANNRKEQESIVRVQLKRIQDGFRKEYDLYKTHQSDVLERIGQLVKEEVQVRVNSELNLKKLTSDIANQIVNDLNGVKEAIAVSNKKLSMSIREVANDSAERAGQLSHYIDKEIRKVVEVVTEKYSKMKNVFTKLAQQLRQHLTNTELNRLNVEKRLTMLEQNFEKLKNEVISEIDEFYGDLDARLKDEKQYVETVVFKKNNELTIRVNKLEEYTNQYFELLKANIQENKQILNKKITNNQQGKSVQNQEEMKELRNIVFNIRNLTQEIKTENKQSLEELKKEIKLKQNQSKQDSISRQTQLREKIEKNNKEIVQLQESIGELTIKMNSLRAQGTGSEAISNDKLKKLADGIEETEKKIKDVQKTVMEDCKNNEEQIIKLRTDITVLKGEVGALDSDIKKLSST